MQALDKLIRVFVGLLFIFSGLVKLNDPMGTAIKMEEYFEVFSTDISSIFHVFVPAALWVGLFVVILEVLLGVAVLINYHMRFITLILLLLIIFFTFLTFYSAAFDKVTDCGCFGDAIPLTPWQSFLKDILLLIFSTFLFIRRTNYTSLLSYKLANTAMTITFVFCLVLAYFALEHLPPIDFRPYKISGDIRAAMLPSEEYRYKYIMEKEGEIVEFENYPSDTSYKFLEMVLLNPEAEPKITDYNVWNEDGDFTEEIDNEIESWVITANDEATYENFRHEYQISLPYFYADGTVIKAMVRANPGLILLKDGIVLGKWHNNDIPAREEILMLIK